MTDSAQSPARSLLLAATNRVKETPDPRLRLSSWLGRQVVDPEIGSEQRPILVREPITTGAFLPEPRAVLDQHRAGDPSALEQVTLHPGEVAHDCPCRGLRQGIRAVELDADRYQGTRGITESSG